LSATIAKEWAETYIKKNPNIMLSADQIASVYLYTTNSIYKLLNAILLDKDREKLKPWFPYLKLILTCLPLLPTKTGQVLERGEIYGFEY